MAQVTQAFLNNVSGIAAGDTTKFANIPLGGQLGIGTRLPLIDAATPQVFTPAVAIVTHTPTMFRQIPHADSILKSLIERHALSISGIDFGYTLESAGVIAGHDGQELQMPTNAKRTAISPSISLPEVQGNLVWRFIKNWICMIRHPDTQASAMAAMFGNTELNPMVFSSFSMDICIIQFDPTMMPENIVDGFMITNMWPTETGNFGLQREVGTTQIQQRDVPFTGIMQHNKSTFRAAQNIARTLNLHRADFENAVPIAEQIEDSLKDKGISSEIETIASEFVEV
jgi:hypothetical protein